MDQLNIGSSNSAEIRNLMDKETLMWEDIEIYASNRIIDFNLIHSHYMYLKFYVEKRKRKHFVIYLEGQHSTYQNTSRSCFF